MLQECFVCKKPNASLTLVLEIFFPAVPFSILCNSDHPIGINLANMIWVEKPEILRKN